MWSVSFANFPDELVTQGYNLLLSKRAELADGPGGQFLRARDQQDEVVVSDARTHSTSAVTGEIMKRIRFEIL